jgi:hypothetical protein
MRKNAQRQFLFIFVRGLPTESSRSFWGQSFDRELQLQHCKKLTTKATSSQVRFENIFFLLL